MRLLDEAFTDHNFKGVLDLRDHLRLAGHAVNAKRVRRLMRLMGHEPVYPKPHLSVPGQGVTPYPYLLRDHPTTASNEVWSTDITYVPMAKGFLYLTAVLDWHSRYVLNWQLSSTLDAGFWLHPGRHIASYSGPLHLQIRPGQPIHRLGLRASPAGHRLPHQPRRPQPRNRQCLY